ncbi:Carbon catabolite repressor protein 4 homolog 3 [Linum perenne]
MNTCSGRAFSSWPTTMLPPSLNRRPSFSTPSQPPPPPAFLCSSKSTQSRSLARRPFYNPLGRLWIEADQCPPPPSQVVERFTVVSYNILGERNSFNHPDLYLEVPSPYLNWDYRRKLICEELIGYDSDIICLQEVDRYFDLLKVMQKAGYEGSYKRCTDDKVDGCAVFWKADKMRLLEGESIEYNQLGLRDNVAQILVFETSRAESRRILIGNIHVIFRPSRGDVKLGQIRYLSSRAQILSEKWGNIPVILTGDFNSTPQSAIYKFLSSSKLNIKLHDRKNLSGQRNFHPTQVFGTKREMGSPLILMDRCLDNNWTSEEVTAATGHSNRDFVKHPLKLSSSYATVQGSKSTRGFNGEPLATSFHSKFVGTVDYLWHSDGIQTMGVLDTLPLDFLKRIGGLPCKTLGSDHLALVSEFAFAEVAEKNITDTVQSTSSASPRL